MRRYLAALLFALSLAPAFAQAPPPVPALPDTERRTSYTITAQTGPFAVNFAIYGDSTDYGNWIQVYLTTGSGVSSITTRLTAVTDYTLSSATGSLGTIPRPITNATITLTVAQTGVLQIVGARRPRRTTQFQENRGVAARDLNQVITDLVAQGREQWDLVGTRVIQGIPGETLSTLPPAAYRANTLLGFNSIGDVTVYPIGGGGGGGSITINCGAGITCTPNPMTTVASIALTSTAVTPGSYGSATQTGTFTVSAQGQLTAAANATITPAFSSLTGTPTTLSGYGVTSPLNVAQGGLGAGTYTANAPLIGNGTSAVGSGSRSGNTTTFGTTSGSLTTGHCIQADASGNMVDSGAACAGTSSSVSSVTAFGAAGDCSTDDTAAFQSAINAAAAAGGSGIVYIPPVASGKCYLVGAINATDKSNLTIQGNGDTSLVKVANFDASQNWWDLAGSSNVTFKTFKVINDASHVPKVLFFVAAENTGSNTVQGITFDRVNVDAKSSVAHLYAYAVSYSGPNTGSGGLTCQNSTWFQRNNGATNADPSRRASVINLNGINSRTLGSSNITITTLNPGTNGTMFLNCNVIDFPSGFGAGAQDNNAAFICVTCAIMTMTGGSIQCNCQSDAVFYTNTEGFTFTNVFFAAPDGTVTVSHFLRYGGGTNGSVALLSPFFSVPLSGGAFIAFDDAVGGNGGIHHLNMLAPDVGGNSFSDPMIFPTFSCTTSAATTWIANSNLQLPDGANDIHPCGNIDTHTILQNPGSITLPSGATDSSHHF